MATRTIRIMGDDILRKTSREVKEVNGKIKTLIDDMLETMYEAEGVGLAAPQVGVLKKIAVVDVSEDGDSPIILINPVLTESDGEQRGYEGCLSVPGKSGIVTRPEYVKVKAFNENMEEVEYEGTGLLARALVHEIEHLEGKMYVDLVEGPLRNNDELQEEEE